MSARKTWLRKRQELAKSGCEPETNFRNELLHPVPFCHVCVDQTGRVNFLLPKKAHRGRKGDRVQICEESVKQPYDLQLVVCKMSSIRESDD